MAEGHRDRVRNRFMTDDTNELPESVVLEAFLHSIIPRRDTHDLAARLLKEFGNFAQVVDAPLESLMRVEGVGKTVATQLKMLSSYLRCYMRAKQGYVKAITNSDEAGGVLLPYFFGQTKELVYVLCLNSAGKLLGCDLVSEGSLGAVQLMIRELLAVALKYHATGVVLAHNHPFGVALPSDDDILATKRLKEVLFGSELMLVDHLIFDSTEFTSMRDTAAWNIWPGRYYDLRIGAQQNGQI